MVVKLIAGFYNSRGPHSSHNDVFVRRLKVFFGNSLGMFHVVRAGVKYPKFISSLVHLLDRIVVPQGRDFACCFDIEILER